MRQTRKDQEQRLKQRTKAKLRRKPQKNANELRCAVQQAKHRARATRSSLCSPRWSGASGLSPEQSRMQAVRIDYCTLTQSLTSFAQEKSNCNIHIVTYIDIKLHIAICCTSLAIGSITELQRSQTYTIRNKSTTPEICNMISIAHMISVIIALHQPLTSNLLSEDSPSESILSSLSSPGRRKLRARPSI
jgi:hypothetical protein